MGVEIKSQGYALLVDYAWCTGCHSCEMACRKEHDYTDDQYGIKVNEMIWPIEFDTWQYTYLPTPTDQCDACNKRLNEGKLPTCVHHCQAECLQFGEVDKMIQKMDSSKRISLFVL